MRAGVLLAADGPASSARGARVRFAGGRATFEEDGAAVTAEDTALATGYWLIDVASRREAVEWVRRCPCEGEVEIRRVPEPAEYATLSPEHEDYL
ncbi:MAG: YciI family protein, partial [Pseudonocardiaceae bacterium]